MIKCVTVIDFLYPREGTETMALAPSQQRSADFLYPREGTETMISLAFISSFRFSLSQRGDGNSMRGLFCRSKSRFSLSPRGDGNPCIMLLPSHCPQDFLYPREGTETHRRTSRHYILVIFFIPARGRKHPFVHHFQLLCRFSLSPRGDGNFAQGFQLFNSFDFLYPREGTETSVASNPNVSLTDFLYPREGTETRIHHAAVSHRHRFSLSPRGDGNLEQYGRWQVNVRLSLSPRGGRKPFVVKTFES